MSSRALNTGEGKKSPKGSYTWFWEESESMSKISLRFSSLRLKCEHFCYTLLLSSLVVVILLLLMSNKQIPRTGLELLDPLEAQKCT